MTDDDFERLLRRSAPAIDGNRLDRVTRSTLLEQGRLDFQNEGWFGWLTAGSGFAFAGLFLLGVVVNLVVRATGPTPLDFLMSQSVLLPWGG